MQARQTSVPDTGRPRKSRFETGRPEKVCDVMEEAGIRRLDGECVEISGHDKTYSAP